jgi:Zn-finger nucleic acid-binding protein
MSQGGDHELSGMQRTTADDGKTGNTNRLLPAVRGIWLAKGKLDRIIERSGAEMPQRVIPQGFAPQPVRRDDEHYDKHHDSHYGGHGKSAGFFMTSLTEKPIDRIEHA